MKTGIKLHQKNLSKIGNLIPIPNYQRSSDKIGIVHIGVGGFHRAHQAYYLHRLRQLNAASEWGICGVGIRESDQKIHDILKKQDHLYTLLIKHPNQENKAEVIGSIVDFKMGHANPEPVIAQMAHVNTKIVSLTITEGGYNFNTNTKTFNFDNLDVQHELKNPNDPKTVYGFLTAALKRRRDNSLPAFTIMSCDNIEHNGDMTRKMLLAFVEKQDAALAEWIAQKVCFPNSMVDRITPVTTQNDITLIEQNFGIKDNWPVTCEPFIQWVIEDRFSIGRPPYEKVGVQFVADVAPYEKMKLRLLNAGHSVLGILGAIYGHDTINSCMDDQIFVRFLKAFLDLEASPVLGEIEGIDLTTYKKSLIERFSNPNIKDSVSRICSESAAKLPKFLIPTIQENLNTDGSIAYATLIIAAWCYYCDKGVNQNGQAIEIIDAMSDELHMEAQKTKNDPLAFLRIEAVFGNLIENERFTNRYTEMIEKIYTDSAIEKHMLEILKNS